MIFVGVALVVAVGLALIVNADAGALVGLTQTQTGQLVALVAVLIFVAGGAFGRRRGLGEMLANLMLWAGIFGVVALGYAYRSDLMSMGDRVMAELAPGAAVVDVAAGTATFRKSMGGSYRVNATINGADIHMIFDTGASAVVLTEADAARAGIDAAELRYTYPVQTANGNAMAALVRLERMEVGEIVRQAVPAFVVNDSALRTSLLGMTFLETLSGYSVANDALVLTD